MRQSKLFGKTEKKDKKFGSVNEEFLIRGGFVHKVMAGAYTMMPLGLRVLNKIETIIREEMDQIGSEMLMTSLAPKEIWEQTKRLDTIDVLMKTQGANEISRNKNTNEYILNCTHEDNITPIAKKFHFSYKDLPVAAYQIQSKFRNEARAKSGLLRGREFIMKDLYSFHTSEADLLDYYHNQAKPAYIRTFQRLGLGDYTVIALASGGDFTKDFSHEFQTKCEAGEDLIFYSKKLDTYFNREVTPSQAPEVEWEKEVKPMERIETKGIVGMNQLVEFLKVPAEKCMKTLIYKTDDSRIVAAGLRGLYEVDTEKLKTIIGCKSLELASEEIVKKVTNAEVGYAGIVGLPDDVEVYVDESMQKAVNFECGGNETHYHNINVNWDKDVKRPEKFYDFKVAQEGDLHPETGEVYEVFKAAEVGNIFPLNTKFSEAIGYKFTDKDGKEKPVFMGSYGIGCTRLMGVIIERFHDENGIIWPMQVAPFHVQLISIGKEDINKDAEAIYNKLQAEGIEVLWDDREITPGVKFGDSDLLGIPYRIVISNKTKEQNGVEVKRRNESESKIMKLEEVIETIKNDLK